MRSEVLRDVVAGCAGVLAVAALIGLPGRASTDRQPQFQYRHAELLPYFHRLEPTIPEPPAPHTHTTTRPLPARTRRASRPGRQIPARQYRGSCPILSWSRAT